MRLGSIPRRGALGCIGLLLLGSCATRLPAAPRPDSVSPTQGTNLGDLTITISGDGLVPRLTTDFNDHTKSGFAESFTVRLGDTKLTSVEVLAGGGLRAIVPRGMAPGKYDLIVIDPYGREGILPDAYEVLTAPSAPTVLVFTSSAQTVRQGSCSGPVKVEVQDGAGNATASASQLRLNFGGDLEIYGDSACANRVDQRDLAPGQSAADAVFFIGRSAGSHTVTVSSPGLTSATQTESIYPQSECPLEAPDGSPCDDGNACTLNDACHNGQCIPDSEVSCPALGVCHEAGTCDPATGLCSDPRSPDGSPCSDGIACTTGETCQDGICAHPLSFEGCASTPPIACFTVTPAAALLGTPRTFNAGCSTDAEDPPTALEARFDFDGDDVFDTPFSNQPQMFDFPGPGLFKVTAEVRDDAGVSSFTTRLVAVTTSSTDVLVTTPLNENDSNATPTSPGGTGLSLREALTYANLTGNKVIHFDGGMTANGTTLPRLTANDVVVIGEQGSAIDFTNNNGGTNTPCLSVEGANDRIIGLRIFGCGRAPLELKGSGVQLAQSDVRGGKSVLVTGSGVSVGPANDLHDFTGNEALKVAASMVSVDGNRIHDNTGSGVVLDVGSDGTTVQRNVLFRNGASAISVNYGASAPVLQFNTVVSNSGDGVTCAAVVTPPISLLNNVFALNRSGVNVNPSSLYPYSPNLYFANTGPSTLDAGVYADPLLLNPDGGDFRPRTESPVVNAGVDVGVDVNGPAAGRFNGAAPDLGAYELP